MASRGSSIFGSGTVSQRISSFPCQTNALIFLLLFFCSKTLARRERCLPLYENRKTVLRWFGNFFFCEFDVEETHRETITLSRSNSSSPARSNTTLLVER